MEMYRTENPKMSDRIQAAVFALLERKKYDQFSIKDVCEEAGISRSTFYEYYQDINDLMIKIENRLARQIEALFNPKEANSTDSFVLLFEFIKKNKIFYKAFLKSGTPSFDAVNMIAKQKKAFEQFDFKRKYNYTEDELEYHLHFFAAGIKAVCKTWIYKDCKEPPEQMAKIIHDEYANNAKYFE